MVTLATSRSLWDFKFWISSSVSICFWMQIFGRKFESKFLAARWRCCLWSPFLKTVSWDQTFPEPKSSFSLKQNKSKSNSKMHPKIHWRIQFATSRNFHWLRLHFIYYWPIGYIKLSSLSVKVEWMLFLIRNPSRIEKGQWICSDTNSNNF